MTFVNTASAKRPTLESYSDLVVWGLETGVLGSADAERLGRAADERPTAAAAVFQRAEELRDRAERVLRRLLADERPDAADLDALNSDFAQVLPHRRLVASAAGYRWAWGDADGDDLDRMLWEVLLSVAKVLISKDRRQVRECAGEECDLLFVDRSSGSPRKWCSMKACGHRVNSRKHYRKVVKPKRERIKAEVEKKWGPRRR